MDTPQTVTTTRAPAVLITERWLALEDEDDNGGDAEKEEEEDLTDIEFDDEPLEEIYDIFQQRNKCKTDLSVYNIC